MNKLKQNTESAFPTAMGAGMTLRDYFAAQAMQPLVLAAMQVAGPESTVDFAAISEAAYRMSDSMLKAREAA